MRWLLERALWAVVSLLGISLVTAGLLWLAPLAPATASATEPSFRQSESARIAEVRAARERAGFIDPASGEERSFLDCYGVWLRHAVILDLAPLGETPAQFRRRIGRSLAVSSLVGGLGLACAVIAGALLGLLTGRLRPAGLVDRAIALPLLLFGGLPDFLIVTLVLLAIPWLGLDAVPLGGLLTPGAESLPLPERLLDLARHVALPALVLAVGPAVAIARFLRESIARTLASEWVFTLRAWGTAPRELNRRVLVAAARPVWTQLGTIVPMLVTGAVVVEQVFALPGFGRLALEAAMAREIPTVVATTHIAAAIVLVGLIASDALHRIADPRVRLR